MFGCVGFPLFEQPPNILIHPEVQILRSQPFLYEEGKHLCLTKIAYIARPVLHARQKWVDHELLSSILDMLAFLTH